ncbi:MAG: hypothetical protein KF760_14625 [Candidatus Eremiobacteraeota bacterium]|nr:hypothetical protein [Candidatus Eremiobacteraeota bacterium]MCW5871926.1 hypothetical protein [Candidatus Eremiobacteraeota bacterium]
MKLLLRLILFLSLLSLALCAPSYRPGQLMLLVIGRSAGRPDADQQALLQRVQALRTSPGLNTLKVATMHFDRPREAAFARQVLGVSAQQLPCVCLVELDAAEVRPVRSLYSWPSVTGARLAEVDRMADMWSQLANAPVPLLTPQPAPLAPVFQAPQEALSMPMGWAAPRPSSQERDRLLAGMNMPVNRWLRSPNGRYGCLFQQGGNLVVYRFDRTPYQPMWNSMTDSRGGVNLRLSNDGVLRMFDATHQVIWEAGDAGAFSHCYLRMQDDGNLVIYRENGNGMTVAWASNSNQSGP